jgi:hypothetical protein
MRTTLAAILLAAAGPAHAKPEATPIHLSVTGDVDRDVLGTSLAAELARSLEGADDACAAPCLAITVADGSVTAVFTPASGPPRQRTMQLADDHTQWPVVITLLAGNLVRDEAADVADLVPEAPPPAVETSAPAPPAAAVVPAPQAEAPPTRSFAIGFVPVVSTDGTNFDRKHFLSFSLIAGVSGGSTGLAISGIADVADGPVGGVQLAGITTVADKLDGIQLTGIAAGAGDVKGVQVAGTAAVADSVDGIQIAGVAAVADGHASTQVAGVATVADGNAGIQVGGVAAVADGNVHFQAGGVAAVAHAAHVQIAGVAAQSDGDTNVQVGGVAAVSDHSNIQIAGVAAVADRISGLQIAPINVAGRVDGLQLGVINIGGAGDGDSFGLINIVPGGRYDIEASVDTNRVGTLLFHHGGRHWHNVYGIGGQRVSTDGPNDDVWMYGAGFGPTFRLGGTSLDVEAMGWQVNHGASHEKELSLLAQLRLTLAIPLGAVDLVAGGVLNTYISTDHMSPFIVERTTEPTSTSSSVTTTVWPSAFVGVRL